jgi:tetratricopeptide (TPR) repeat protein
LSEPVLDIHNCSFPVKLAPVYATRRLAISNYNIALEMNPNYALAYINRARTYYLKKEYNKSWEDVKKAQALDYKIPLNFLMIFGRLQEGKSEGNDIHTHFHPVIIKVKD